MIVIDVSPYHFEEDVIVFCKHRVSARTSYFAVRHCSPRIEKGWMRRSCMALPPGEPLDLALLVARRPGSCPGLPLIGRFGRIGATARALAARPPGSVPLPVPRCDLALGRTPGLPPVAFMRGADKDTGSNFSWRWGNACSAWSSGPGRPG